MEINVVGEQQRKQTEQWDSCQPGWPTWQGGRSEYRNAASKEGKVI